MEQGYKPDGWLGLMIGSKYFIDFSGKYKFEDKLGDLFRELDRILKPETIVKENTKTESSLVSLVYVYYYYYKTQLNNLFAEKGHQHNMQTVYRYIIEYVHLWVRAIWMTNEYFIQLCRNKKKVYRQISSKHMVLNYSGLYRKKCIR